MMPADQNVPLCTKTMLPAPCHHCPRLISEPGTNYRNSRPKHMEFMKESEEHMPWMIKSNLMACELLHFLPMPDLLHGYFQSSFDLIPEQFLYRTTPVKKKY